MKRDDQSFLTNLSYQKTLYRSQSLREVAQRLAAYIHPDVNLFLSGGSSSCVLTAAVMALLPSVRNVEHIHVYPEHHTGHRGSHKSSSGNMDASVHSGVLNIAILDDLVDSGRTVRNIFNLFMKEIRSVSDIRVDSLRIYPCKDFFYDTEDANNFVKSVEFSGAPYIEYHRFGRRSVIISENRVLRVDSSAPIVIES